MILPSTRLEGEFILSDGIRSLIEGKSQVEALLANSVTGVTVSAGIALYRPGEASDNFIERADQCCMHQRTGAAIA